MAQTKAQLVVGLNVNASAPASALQIDASGNVNLDSNTLYVDATNNRVGVGTTSPSYLLHLAASEPVLNIASSATTGDGAQLRFVQNNGRVGRLYLTAEGGPGAGAMTLENPDGRDIIFKHTSNERLRIDSSGRVGIGTSSPGGNLTVTDASTYTLNVNANAGGAGALLSTVGGSAALALGTNSTERVRITAAGNVGIGTTSPGTPLEIGSSTDTSTLRFRSTFTSFGSVADISCVGTANETSNLVFSTRNLGGAVTERCRLDASGRLLVGTSSARDNFYNTTGEYPAVQIEGTDYNKASLAITLDVNTVTAPRLVFGKTRGGSIGSNTIVQSGDQVGVLSFQGSDGTNLVDAARIQCEVDGTPGADDMPGRLVFSVTADGQSSPTERFRIASGGQLGIGGANYGTSGQVLTSQGSGAAPQWATPSSPAIVQKVVKEYSTPSTFTSPYVPFDNTGLQVNETHLIITQSFTPVSTSNKLFLTAQIGVMDVNSGGNPMTVGIWTSDSSTATADALAWHTPYPATYAQPVRCEYQIGGTLASSYTFYVRVGSTGGTWAVNRRVDAQYFGGVVRSYLTIEEFS